MKETHKLYNSITNLNEEYIEEARNTQRVKHRPAWIKYCAMAACLCLAAAAVFAIPSMPSREADAGKGGSLLDGDPNGYNAVPGGQTPDGWEVSEQDPLEQTQPATAESNTTAANTTAEVKSLAVMERAVIQIERWQPEGFVGIIVDAGGSGVFQEEEEVTVWFEDYTEVLQADGSIFPYNFDEPNAEACGLPAGSSVLVEFQRYEYTAGEGAYNRIYAEHVAPSE